MKLYLILLICVFTFISALNAQNKPKKEVIIPDSSKATLDRKKDIELKPEEVVFSGRVPERVLDNMPVRQPDPSIKYNMPCVIAGSGIKYNMPEYQAAAPASKLTVTRKNSDDVIKPWIENFKSKKDEKK
jgi:hypothetical protein